MLIKNDTELNKALQQVASKALAETQEKIRQCIDNFVRQYYAEYTPRVYERTYQFLESITKTNVSIKGNTITCEVYINEGLHYEDNTMEVLDIINQGYHGNKRIKGTPVWKDSEAMIEQMNLFYGSFKEALVKQGFTVV